MMKAKQDLQLVREFYTTPRLAGPQGENIYEIWEKGQAFNDSVTPSTYVPEYRWHMVLKIVSLSADGQKVFSLGCGNGFVEAELACLNRKVLAIDCNEEAVELSRRKGVDAFAADFYALEDLADADVIYADGFLGHLFDARDGFRPSLGKLISLHPKSGAYLVISNDAPKDGQVCFAPHERLPDFWLIAKDYLAQELAGFGLQPVEAYYFPYVRPVSGMRNRTICVARVP